MSSPARLVSVQPLSDPARLTVAFAGEPGSFAEDAVLAAYPDASALAVPLFEDVVRSVSAGEAVAGVLPIENVVGGGVREVYDLLLDSQEVVVGEVIVPVRLCLAALPGQRLEDYRACLLAHPGPGPGGAVPALTAVDAARGHQHGRLREDDRRS